MCVFQSCFSRCWAFSQKQQFAGKQQRCRCGSSSRHVAQILGIVGFWAQWFDLWHPNQDNQDVEKKAHKKSATLPISSNFYWGLLLPWATDSYTLNEKVDFGGTYFPSLPFGMFCHLDLFGGIAAYFRTHSFKAGRCLIASSLKFIGPL